MKKPFAQKVRVSLEYPTYELLKQYALAARIKSAPAMAARIITDWLADRAEIGDGIPVVGKKVQRTPILQELLNDMEQRMAATLNGQSESIYELRAGIKQLVEILERRSS